MSVTLSLELSDSTDGAEGSSTKINVSMKGKI
jgi:hypothetical protein